MSVTANDVQTLADLARLSITPEECATFTGQIGKILDYITELQQVDVSDVPEYLPPEVAGSALRPDELGDLLTSEQALAGVPQKRGRLVVVPKFKEDA